MSTRFARGLAVSVALCAALSASAAVNGGAFAADTQTTPQLTKAQRLADFDVLVKTISENYPYLWAKQRATGSDWRARTEEFRGWVAQSADDAAFYEAMAKVVSALQNAHTEVLQGGELDSYRAEIQKLGNFDDIARGYTRFGPAASGLDEAPAIIAAYRAGNYWVSSSRVADVPVGAIVRAVDGDPVATYVTKQRDRSLLLHDAKRGVLYAQELPLPEADVMSLIVDTPSAKGVFVPQVPTEVSVQGSAPSPRTPNLTTAVLEPGKTAYIGVRSFGGPNIARDRSDLVSFLRSVKDFEHIVIDIRGNGGGDDAYWRELLVAPLLRKSVAVPQYFFFRSGTLAKAHARASAGLAYTLSRRTKGLLKSKLKGLPKEVLTDDFAEPVQGYVSVKAASVGFRGRISLLVDDQVFSSAETFASFAKATGWAKIVGTATGGDGSGIGPLLFVLPGSKLVVRMAAAMGLNPDGSSSEETKTQPDLYAEPADGETWLTLAGPVTASPDPSGDAVLKAALNAAPRSQGTSLARAEAKVQSQSTSALPVSLGIVTNSGFSTEPGLGVTVSPPYAGDHTIGAVWDIPLSRPAGVYTAQRYLSAGASAFARAAYAPWPSGYDLSARAGLEWTPESGKAFARAYLDETPSAGLPPRQAGMPIRRTANASFLATLAGHDTSLQVYAKASKGLGAVGGLIEGGATFEYRMTRSLSMHAEVVGGSSTWSNEFSLTGNDELFSVPTTTTELNGEQAMRSTMNWRYRPLLDDGFMPVPFDLWMGPQIDFGWVGHPSTLTEDSALSAGFVVGVDLGSAANRTTVRMGLGSPAGFGGIKPTVFVSATGTPF